MREIKFRGKDSDGKWWQGSLAYFPDSQSAHIIPCGSCKNDQVICDFVEVNPDTVGQYTRYKDVNGVEIYGGDIIQFARRDCPYQQPEDIATVLWDVDKAMFAVQCKYSNEPSFIPFGEWHRCYRITVIGNVHDNPELIK